MGGRVLMVSYPYPPSASVAAHRPSKFARYLPEFGWEPVVIARRADRRQPLDLSLSGHPEPRMRLNPVEPSRLLGFLPRTMVEPLRRFLFVPDEETGWMVSLAASLPGMIERLRPDVLWANSVPPGTLVAASLAARRTGCPFVADFHNEWTRNMYYRPATRLHDRFHHALERDVVATARATVTLNPLHTQDLRDRFPGARCETIENGYDPSDYEVRPRRDGRQRVFMYAGAIYGYQSPDPFLRALQESGLSDVEVRIVGDRFLQFRGETGRSPVRLQGHVPHRELGPVFSEASAFFLCLETPAARQLPAKLYEYHRAGRPIFAIVPRGGAAEQWIARTGSGASVPFEEPGRWGAALREFVASMDDFKPRLAEEYHRRALTSRLAAILDGVSR